MKFLAMARKVFEMIDKDYSGTITKVELVDAIQNEGEIVDFLQTSGNLTFRPGQHKRAKFPASKAPISAIFHSFRLILGRAIISRNGLEAWMCFS